MQCTCPICKSEFIVPDDIVKAEFARMGGRSRSEAKITASRINALKGSHTITEKKSEAARRNIKKALEAIRIKRDKEKKVDRIIDFVKNNP